MVHWKCRCREVTSNALRLFFALFCIHMPTSHASCYLPLPRLLLEFLLVSVCNACVMRLYIKGKQLHHRFYLHIMCAGEIQHMNLFILIGRFTKQNWIVLRIVGRGSCLNNFNKFTACLMSHCNIYPCTILFLSK